MPKVLITGTAGLFGNNFSRYLLKKGYEIIGIDNFSGGYKEDIHSSIKQYNANITDQEIINKIFKKEKPEIVFHFAAYAAEGLSHYIRKFNYENNLIASINLINACINNDVRKIIFTSSMATYGECHTPPFHEEMQPCPIDPYGVAKYATELDLKNANVHFGLDYSIIRPHNVIGKYQNIWDKYRNVIGIWIRQALNREPITIFGDGLQKRAFSDISFCLEPMEKLINCCSTEIFNIGSDKPIEIIEAAKILQRCAKNFGYNTDIVLLDERKEAKFAYSDHSKARKMLDFHDNTNLEEVINEMLEWALVQPKREIKNMKYEIEKEMYSFWKH